MPGSTMVGLRAGVENLGQTGSRESAQYLGLRSLWAVIQGAFPGQASLQAYLPHPQCGS